MKRKVIIVEGNVYKNTSANRPSLNLILFLTFQGANLFLLMVAVSFSLSIVGYVVQKFDGRPS